MIQPKGLDRITDLAQRIEERALQAVVTGSSPIRGKISNSPNWTLNSIRQNQCNFSSPNHKSAVTEGGARAAIPTGAVPLPFKKLSEAELKSKKERGLCFPCNEKYSIGHKCKNKEL